MTEGVLYITERFSPARERTSQPIGKRVEAEGLRRRDEAPAHYKLESWGEISFDLDEEYLIDGVLPKRGVGLLYGASQTFKSFIATHMGLCLALSRPWAGRLTTRAAVVYLAAEGAAGLRKRKEGYVKAGRAPDAGIDFTLLSSAPNFGSASGDYEKLVATIEAAKIQPGLVVVDTVSKVIGGGRERRRHGAVPCDG
jgi:RecA-family ATPase